MMPKVKASERATSAAGNAQQKLNTKTTPPANSKRTTQTGIIRTDLRAIEDYDRKKRIGPNAQIRRKFQPSREAKHQASKTAQLQAKEQVKESQEKVLQPKKKILSKFKKYKEVETDEKDLVEDLFGISEDKEEVEEPESSPPPVEFIQLPPAPQIKDNPSGLASDPLKNPMGWVNEFYQNKNLLVEFNISEKYRFLYTVHRLADNIVYSNKVTFMCIRDNLVYSFTATGAVKKALEQEVCYMFYQWLYENMYTYKVGQPLVDSQMDSTQSTEQGVENLEGEKRVNTILTRDVPKATDTKIPVPSVRTDMLLTLSTGEPVQEFESLNNRWFKIKDFTIDSGMGVDDGILYLELPQDVYKINHVANRLVFNQFVFNKTSMEVRVKVNGHKFCQGRAVCGYFYQMYTLGKKQHNNVPHSPLKMRQIIQRHHAYIDYNESNEVSMIIPFQHVNTMITSLVNSDIDHAGANYCTFAIKALSKLRVPDESPQSIPGSVYVRFLNTSFTGMRQFKQVDGQMGNTQAVMDTCKEVMSTMKSIPVIGGIAKVAGNVMGHGALALTRPFVSTEQTKRIEKNFKYCGVISNRDKPAIFDQPAEFRPNYAGNLAVGVEAEPVNIFRLDPTATTVQTEELMLEGEVQSLLEITRIWGYYGTFEFKISQGSNTLIWSDYVDPIPYKALMASNLKPKQAAREFTPLETVTNMFQFYSGSIEYRFDFICTQFHTGLVMVSFIPYNPAVAEQEARSSYYKIFDLREQKSFTFTVPYINNTILRMVPTANIQAGCGLQLPSAGTLCVYVQNPLTPIQSVPTTVDVVVYKRAGSDYRLTGIKSFTGRGHPHHPTNLEYGFGKSRFDSDDGFVDGQMPPIETGEKENIDDTPNFGSVPSVGAYMQSLEDQTIIKDLMRRWVFIEQVEIATDQYYQHMVTLPHVTKEYLRSHQSIISTFFRWYRGSIRFMIEFTPNNSTHSFNNTTIDVMHIPVSTQAASGIITQDTDGTISGIRSYAGTTVRPEVNPCIKFEVPFMTPFNYLDNQVGRLGISNTSLDVVAGNLGTFVIHSKQPVKARIYFSMGDDAMLYHFIGCGQTSMFLHVAPEEEKSLDENIDTRTKILRNTEPHVVDSQMMESEEEEPEEFYDVDLNDDSDPMSQYTVADDTPFPKPKGFYGATKQRIANSMSSLKESLSAPFSGITQRVKKLDALADKADSILDNVQRIAGEIVNSIKSKFSWITNTTMIFSSIVHFLQACIAKTWYGVALGIVGILLNLGFIAVDMCDTFLEFFSNMFRSSKDQRTEEHSVDSQCEHRCTQRSCAVKCSPNCNTCTDNFTASDISTLVGLACGAVSGVLGFKAGVPKGLTQGLFCMTRNFWSTISVASRFLSNLMDLFFRLFRHYISKKESTQLDYFIRNNAEDVEEFVKEAHLMLDERNLPAFENDPMYKHRFWLCVVNAYALQKRYTLNPVPEAGSLLRLCKQVIDLSNKIAVQATSCPVRFEPYVITLSGEAKVGKSTLAQHVIPEILSDEKGLNLRTYASPIYVRVPGIEYWNSFKNQPAILFDDFLASLDPMIATAQVADLYMLKSTALMNVNMADLNDKKMLCNSFLVWLNRNNPFQVPNGIANDKAFLRRQEHVWHVELKSQYNSISDVPEDVLSNWGHLNFYKYRDPTDQESLNRDRTYTYDQWLEDVKSDFAKYLEKERKMVTLRVNRLKLTLPRTAGNLLEDADPFKIFYQSYMEAVDDPELSQTGFLPSEAIERQLELVSETVDQIRLARQQYVADASNPPPRTEQNNQHSYYYSEPSTSRGVDGQIPMPEFVNSSGHYVRNVYRMLKERTKQALHWLIYRPPLRELRNAPHFLRDSRPYGTCPVCLEDNVEIWTSCPNDPNHGTCRNCWQGMLNSGDGGISCPVCRNARFVEIEIDEDASEQLRVILMWKHLKSAAKYSFKQSKRFFKSRWFPLLACNAWFLISFFSQLRELDTWYQKQLEIVHNTYDFVSDGMFSGESVDRISDKGREMRHYVRYDPIRMQYNNDRGMQSMSRLAETFIPGVHANKYSWARRNDDNARTVPSFKTYVGKFGQSSNVEQIWNDNFGTEYTWDQLDSQIGPNFYAVDVGDGSTPVYQTPEQIPDYVFTVPKEKPKICPIVEDYCKHKEMFRDPANVYYERQPNGVYMWVYTRHCIAQYELHDKPCQHKDCCFAKWSTRRAILNLWYKHHHEEVVYALQNFNYDPTCWHYPREFLPEACQEAVYDTRQAIMEQLAGIPHRTSWFEWICEKGEVAWQKFGKVIKVGLAFLAALGVALAGYNLVKLCFGGKGEEESEQVTGQIHNSGAFHNRTLARTNRQVKRHFAAGQMDQIEEVVMRYIMRNSVILHITYKENGRPMANKTRGLGVFGRVMLLNKHIALAYLKFKHRSDKGEIQDFKLVVRQFSNPELEVEVKIEKETFLFGTNEIAVMRLPNYFPQFKDVTNFIMTADQHNQIGSEYTHVEVDRDGKQVVRSIPGKIIERVDTVTLKACDLHPQVDAFDMYLTNYGAEGACGSVYIAPGQAPIFAMHSAGINARKKRDIGYGCPIIREDIEALKAGEAVLDYFVPRSSTADAQMTVSGKCVVLAKVGKDQTPYMPTKTKIKPSLLQGKIEGIELKTQPGILTSRDPRWKFEMTPLYWGIQKHLEPPKGFPTDAVQAAYEDLRSVIIHNVTPLRPEPGVLDWSTACVGMAIDYYDPMKLETSAGWPWCATQDKTKAELVKYTRDAQQRPIKAEIDTGVLEVLKRKREFRSRGIRPLTVFVDWLKDERRKQSKLDKPGGTRVFCASPIDFTIECRAFFLDFIAAYMKARMDAEHCVGISTDGPEWTELVRRLSVIKGPFADGDFSDFGPRASSQVAKFAFDIILDWYSVYGNYSDEEMKQARVMVEELINADHIATNVIYRTVCGLPSGSALTVIQNTLQLCLYFRIAWYEMMVKGYNYKMSDYHRLVRIFGYGDDCIMKIDESIAERFNIQTLSSFFEIYTLRFTDASKLGTSKTTPFSEVSFLKCGFKEHPYRKGEYLAPIDETSIHECAQWIWKSRDDKAATLENAEQSLRLAYGHGPEYFRDWKRRLDTALIAEGLSPLRLTWEEIDRGFFGELIIGDFERAEGPIDELLGLRWYKPQKRTDEPASQKKKCDLSGVFENEQDIDYIPTEHVEIRRLTHEKIEEEIEKIERSGLSYTGEELEWSQWL